MDIRFDEHDDVVVDNIPDDIMVRLEFLAKRHDRTVEDEMRDALTQMFAPDATG